MRIAVIRQALQFAPQHGEVCPAGWRPGQSTDALDAAENLAEYATRL